MIKIDVTQVPSGLSDKPFGDEHGQPLTLKSVFVTALSEAEPQTSPMNKIKMAKFAERIYAAEKIELTSEEVTMLKDCVGKRFLNTVLVMRVCEMLDPPVEEKAE